MLYMRICSFLNEPGTKGLGQDFVRAVTEAGAAPEMLIQRLFLSF